MCYIIFRGTLHECTVLLPADQGITVRRKTMPPHCDRETVIYSDEIFINAGDPISSLFILIKGNVKIKSVSTSGDNAIIASLSAPQILGITEFLRRMDTFGASVYADGDCQVIKVSVTQFENTPMWPCIPENALLTVRCGRISAVYSGLQTDWLEE